MRTPGQLLILDQPLRMLSETGKCEATITLLGIGEDDEYAEFKIATGATTVSMEAADSITFLGAIPGLKDLKLRHGRFVVNRRPLIAIVQVQASPLEMHLKVHMYAESSSALEFLQLKIAAEMEELQVRLEKTDSGIEVFWSTR